MEKFTIGHTMAKRKVLKEVLFDDVEEKKEYEFLTRDQFFQKVPETRPMSAHGVEMWKKYLQDPKGFQF
tara:strand:+ start:58 stop:264 length:207 start_codon:yes stop_codon:yes gene_type:complete